MSQVGDYLESVYKEMYKAELDRSEKLDAQIGLPTVIVTIFLGASAFYFEHPPEIVGGLKYYSFYFVIVLYVIAVIATIVCMIRSYTKYYYALVPSPDRIGDRVKILQEYYTEYYGEDDPAIDEEVKKAIQEELTNFYRQAATENRRNNVKRTSWLFYTTISIVASLVLLLISRLVFYSIANPAKTSTIKVSFDSSGSHAFGRPEVTHYQRRRESGQ